MTSSTPAVDTKALLRTKSTRRPVERSSTGNDWNCVAPKSYVHAKHYFSSLFMLISVGISGSYYACLTFDCILLLFMLTRYFVTIFKPYMASILLVNFLVTGVAKLPTKLVKKRARRFHRIFCLYIFYCNFPEQCLGPKWDQSGTGNSNKLISVFLDPIVSFRSVINRLFWHFYKLIEVLCSRIVL